MTLRLVTSVFRSLSSIAFLIVVGACNGQGEGDICDLRNGNNDCQNGYVCTMPPPPFMGTRCCPGNQALATVAACKVSSGGLDAGTAAPDAATGPVDAAPSDAAAPSEAAAASEDAAAE
jgi:hypothetical protein